MIISVFNQESGHEVLRESTVLFLEVCTRWKEPLTTKSHLYQLDTITSEPTHQEPQPSGWRLRVRDSLKAVESPALGRRHGPAAHDPLLYGHMHRASRLGLQQGCTFRHNIRVVLLRSVRRF
jgi:hypothetical protein